MAQFGNKMLPFGGAAAVDNRFIISVKTDNAGTSGTNQFTIPTNGTYTYDYNIETSDGQIILGRTGNTTITFPSIGTYDIYITGTFPQIYFNNTGDRLKLLNVKNFGFYGTGSISQAGAFFGCSNMVISATDIGHFENVTSLSNTFRDCTSLISIPLINTSSVTNFGGTFSGCISFNQNLGSWNVSNATSFASMFLGATAFNNGGSSDINNWVLKTTGTVDMNSMFRAASVFNQPLNLWNTIAVTNMVGMFLRANLFNQNIGSWNVSNVTNMASMFQNQFLSATYKFNNGGSPDINNWDVSKVTRFDNMFYGAREFNQPLNLWNTIAATNMAGMFQGTYAFNQNLGSWNTSAVTNMSNMFNDAREFNQDIGNWHISNVTNFANFMANKTPTTFSTTNLDAIYNGWSSIAVKPSITISFGTAKYTAASSDGRLILTSSPNNWVITDGGI